MAHNTFDLTLALATKVMRDMMVRSTFTGASGVDSSLDGLYSDDHFNRGTVWMLDTATARESSGVAANVYDIVTDYAGTTAQFTISDITTASGKNYVAAPGRYTLGQMLEAINDAVQSWGDVFTWDKTSLDTASSQTEYDLPFTQGDLKKVWLQGKTGDSNDNKPTPLRDWWVQKEAGGTADKLIFENQPISARDIWLGYSTPHAYFTLNIGGTYQNLDESLSFEWVIAEAAYLLVVSPYQNARSTNANQDKLVRQIEQERNLQRSVHQRKGVNKDVRLFMPFG